LSDFFQEKIGLHPSVATPGDTNPSDAIGHNVTVHVKLVTEKYLRIILTIPIAE